MAIIHTRFGWRSLGAVTLAAGKLTFPGGLAVPGVWRVTVGGEAYHGAAKDLRAAMYALTTPGPTQSTNQRVHEAAQSGVIGQQLVVVDVVTAAEAEVNGRLVPLNLDLDDNRALVKAAWILTTEHADPDPESAEYRRAHAAARDAVCALAATDLMKAVPGGKPSKPDNADVKLMRETQTVLNAFVAMYDPYWFNRWGHEGNPGAR